MTASREFLNVEGGSVEQVRDGRLRLHHCANYAAALTVLSGAAGDLRILELGCGSGLMSAAFARLMPANWKLTATDYSWRLVEHARRCYQGANIVFECMNVRDLNTEYLKDFDAVMFLEVIEHLSPAEVLDLLARIYAGLKPGGKVVITTLDRSPFRRAFSGYAPHRIEYRYKTLRSFLQDRRRSPFEEVQVFRLISPRIVREAVRSEVWGGYLINRLVALGDKLNRRYPSFCAARRKTIDFLFRLYDRLVPRRKFKADDYINEIRLVTEEPERYEKESFSLVAVLRKTGY